jgi:hypothetical protein
MGKWLRICLGLGGTLLWSASISAAPATPAPAAPSAKRTAEPPLPIDSIQEANLLKFTGPGFQTVRTPHFVVAYDTSRPLVMELLSRLEETYHAVYRFADSIGIEPRRLNKRLEVIFFNRRDAYDRYGASLEFNSRGTYGVYHEPSNRSAFFNVYNDPQLLKLLDQIKDSQKNLDELSRTLKSANGNQALILSYGDGRRETVTAAQAKKRLESMRRDLKTLDAKRTNYSERINCTVIQHEAAHQVLFNAGVHVRGGANPKWVIEGLAMMFETQRSESGAGLAAINQFRLKDFRDGVAGGQGRRPLNPANFLAAITEKRFEPPKRLVGDPRVFNERDEQGVRVYALSWSLANYLQRRQPKKLGAYLKEISERRPGVPVTPDEEVALFEKHFGTLDDNFVRQWGKYTLDLNYRATPGLGD